MRRESLLTQPFADRTQIKRNGVLRKLNGHSEAGASEPRYG